MAKGSAEDCLKKQSDANGSEPLKGSPPNGSKKIQHIYERLKTTTLNFLSPESIITALIKRHFELLQNLN